MVHQILHGGSSANTQILSETWTTWIMVYLLEDWYQSGRWELCAHSAHALMPVLKTTMILQIPISWFYHTYRCETHKFKPACDQLSTSLPHATVWPARFVWILVSRLAPTYYQKLDMLQIETSRYRESSSWWKDFRKMWCKHLSQSQSTTHIGQMYKSGYVPARHLLSAGSLSANTLSSPFIVCQPSSS